MQILDIFPINPEIGGFPVKHIFDYQLRLGKHMIRRALQGLCPFLGLEICQKSKVRGVGFFGQEISLMESIPRNMTSSKYPKPINTHSLW